MRVGIDIDGILRDFDAKVTDVYKQAYPTHVVPETTDWNMAKIYPIGEAIYRFVFQTHAEEIFYFARPYPGAEWFVKELEKEHQVVLVTTQQEGVRGYTLDWLKANGIPSKHLMFTDNKALADVDVLLDDAVHNLVKFAESGRTAICFDRPWNQDWLGKRVHTYTEFLNILKGNQ